MFEGTISTFSVTKGGRVEETYACFELWNLDSSLDENLDRFAETNPILASTESWLKEMRRIFRVRFGDVERHRPLIELARAGFPLHDWAPLLLWHLCYRELLLADFLETWLYERRSEGVLRVKADDVTEYLATLRPRGLLDAEWSKNTINRMASGLPAYAADFGLLEGRVVREIVPYHLPETAFLYVLYAMSDEGLSPRRMLDDRRWRRFLMSSDDVEHQLLRLHQLQKVSYHTAGSAIDLDFPFTSLNEYAASLV